MNKNTEILAPAGSFEALEAALKCGADAVYIGGKYFSARGNAKNFSDEEIADACNLCHLYGKKLYIAVNTVISDNEADLFCNFIKYTSSVGADAYIVQDWGCLYLIKKCVPDAVIHASTQMTLHTPEGAEFAKQIGFSRIVPARELSAGQIEKISECGLETEVFVHGALCMSVSGQCYFSAMLGTRSANRGVCGQVCRLPFSACGNKNANALSLKDLSLLNHISELQKCGVDSLKIEGRMKRPEYVASAVIETKKALSGKSPDSETLKSIFSRSGFTDGYFTEKRYQMFGIRLKNDVISAQSLLPDIRKSYQSQPRIYSLDFDISIKENQQTRLLAFCPEYGLSVTVSGDVPEKAVKKSADLQYAERQLSKLGDTIFKISEISGDIDDGLMISASSLNAMRREAVNKMQEAIINKNKNNYNINYNYSINNNYNICRNKKPELRIQCRNSIQAKAAEPYADMLIIPLEECEKALETGIDKNKICILPPRFILNEINITNKIKLLCEKGLKNILCVNPAYIKTGKELGLKLHGGFGLNVTNSFSCKMLAECGLDDITLSFEMKLSQLKKIKSPVPLGIISYGQLPLMLVRNCPIKNEVGCKKCRGYLTDRTGRSFPVRCQKDYAEIFNADTLCLDEKEISGFDFALIILGDEKPEDIKSIADFSAKPDFPTKGLYYRGITK